MSLPGWAIGAGGLAATIWFVAPPGNVVTIAQRDAHRSPIAARTVDVSADGRFIAIQSLARLVPADRDDYPDIYVLDRTTGRVTLDSRPADDDQEHTLPRISGDGRWIVFETRSTRHLNMGSDITLYDRLTETTRLIAPIDRTRDLPAWSRNPTISTDGAVVAFSSSATALVGGTDANGPIEDVYVVNVHSGVIARASLGSDGQQRRVGDSILPSLSADGRWLAFASTAPLDLPPAKAEARQPRHIYLRDMTSGRVTRVSRALNNSPTNGNSSLPSVSADGRQVVFISEASNLLPADDNRLSDVFLYNRDKETLEWITRGADGSAAAGASYAAVLSGDGRFVAFQSDAGNLVCARRCSDHVSDINLLWDVFLYDRVLKRMRRISEDELGGWMSPSVGPALDHSGQIVAFSARQPVDAEDKHDDFDLFIRALSMESAGSLLAPLDPHKWAGSAHSVTSDDAFGLTCTTH
jgi:Tol biopolymer transport system component